MDSLCHYTVSFQIRNNVVNKLDLHYTINEDKEILDPRDPVSFRDVSLVPTSSKPLYQYTFNEVAEIAQHAAVNTVLPAEFAGYSTSMLTLTGSVSTNFFGSGSTDSNFDMDWFPSSTLGYYPPKITSGSS